MVDFDVTEGGILTLINITLLTPVMVSFVRVPKVENLIALGWTIDFMV